VLFLLGGLAQINPIWLWGPYHTYTSTNGAQPDWYLGWLIGALRLMPGWDFVIGRYTVIPNPFWGGALFPLAVFGFLFTWPWVERRFVTRDYGYHNLLQRPRDAPLRTGVGVGVFTFVALVFVAGAADRIDVLFGWSYTSQIWTYRVAIWLVPIAFGVLAHRVCVELLEGEHVERSRKLAEEMARRDAERHALEEPA
jgi:ubiquinol-cytochrome c reductase cytochrome b subunit